MKTFLVYHERMKELEQWINNQPSRMVAYRALAEAADCRWQQVPKWLRIGYVPTRRVSAVSRLTGIKPSRLNAVVGALHQIELIRDRSR